MVKNSAPRAAAGAVAAKGAPSPARFTLCPARAEIVNFACENRPREARVSLAVADASSIYRGASAHATFESAAPVRRIACSPTLRWISLESSRSLNTTRDTARPIPSIIGACRDSRAAHARESANDRSADPSIDHHRTDASRERERKRKSRWISGSLSVCTGIARIL